jgi:pimeloyl-ACP methyl ester carboxylesterase
MPELTINGLRFHVIVEGEGAPVVLLHGFPDTSHVWRHQILALVRAGYRVIAPDLRGRGQTEAPAHVEDYRLTNSVSDVAAILDALGVTRAHVVAHDWGAAVGWLFAALMPQRIEHLAALSVANPAARGRADLAALQKGWYRLLFLFPEIERVLQQDDWYLLRALFGEAKDLDRYLAGLSAPGALTAGLNWYRANMSIERLAAPPPDLPPVQAPTLGVFGMRDPFLTEEAMARSGETVRGSWRYERFDEAGHWIQLDAPDRLNALLLEFLGA